MQSENWKNVREVLRAALEIEPARRREFLDSAAPNAEIRREVESLLACEAESEDFMSLPIGDFSSDFLSDDESENPLIGQQIGNYEIVGELGQGGMGAVYLAQRADGKFEQKVALKLLRREINISALRRRFQQEREILAALEHPNIARLLDAGTTDDKIPFLAMEYVEGLPIDDYCNLNSLDLGERLDLFRKVCAAVDFAHRNLIVHRDLKPSNILIDKQGNPKLLDFGISKILSAEFDKINSSTVTKLGVMTPGYASPEQLQNKSVTTATDIYSLGVILYELLSGHRPFETKEDNLEEIYKAVLETEPERPSSVIQNSKFKIQNSKAANGYKFQTEDSVSEDQALKTKDQNQKTDFKSTILNPKVLKGDLDNIVLKALRKEPERRYLSAENFAEDIHRYQRGLPVTARSNTFSYRAEKFIKRNRISVAVAGLLLLAVIAGIAATLWQARVARAERDRARLEAEKAEKINLFLQNVLNLSNPMWMSGNPDSNRNATLLEAVDEAAKAVETTLTDQPEIQAEINFTLGKTYFGQGKYDKARDQFLKAKERFAPLTTDNSLKQNQIDVSIGATDYFEGGKFDNEAMLTDAVSYFRANLDKGGEYKTWCALALNVKALILQRDKRRFDEMEKLFREALQYAMTLQGQDRWLLTNILNNLATIPNTKSDEDIQLYETAIKEANALTDKPRSDVGVYYLNLSVLKREQKSYAEAKNAIQKGYEILIQTQGEEHIFTILSHKHLAHLYYLEGDYKNAKAEIDIAVKNIQKQSLKRPNLYLNNVEQLWSLILLKTGEEERAESIAREVLGSFETLMKSPHVDIAKAKQTLGEILFARKKYAEAKEILVKAEKEFIETVGEEHSETKKSRELLSKIP